MVRQESPLWLLMKIGNQRGVFLVKYMKTKQLIISMVNLDEKRGDFL